MIGERVESGKGAGRNRSRLARYILVISEGAFYLLSSFSILILRKTIRMEANFHADYFIKGNLALIAGLLS